MKKICNQHGDVLLEKLEKLPEGLKRVTTQMEGMGWVIEKGEGVHKHHISCAENVSIEHSVWEQLCNDLEAFEDNEGNLYFKVKHGKSVKLSHEEHGTQILEPGIYKKNIEQVFDYEDMESRKVVD